MPPSPIVSRLFHDPLILIFSLATITWWLWPADSELWRKAAALVLSVGLGFQMTKAIRAVPQNGAAAIMGWVECLACPLMMEAFVYLPLAKGWLLLAGGSSWYFLVRNLWK